MPVQQDQRQSSPSEYEFASQQASIQDDRAIEADLQYIGLELNDPPAPSRDLGLKTLIVAALGMLFVADVLYPTVLNVTPLYVVVIFLALSLQRVRWVLGVTVATLLLNLFALRWNSMYPHDGWSMKFAISHLLMAVGTQVPAGILAYRSIITQRRLEDNRDETMKRQRALYERERAARAAEQEARRRENQAAAELQARAEQLQRIIESEHKAREREREARGERDYLRELQEKFQRILLPVVPSKAANGQLALGPLYQPAIQEMQMGGDFYDAMTLPNGLVGLVIGDVAGHGVEAAAQTAFVTTTLRAFATEDPTSPSRVLARVNRSLTLDRKFDAFVSLFYGVYDPKSGMLRYSNAGHEPPILIHPDDKVEPLDSTGLVVGVDSQFAYGERETQFKCGDCLILLTDGITEARNRSKRTMLGWDGVAKLALEHRKIMVQHNESPGTASQISPDDLAHALYQEALAFTGGEDTSDSIVGAGLTDDVALLVVVALKGEPCETDDKKTPTVALIPEAAPAVVANELRFASKDSVVAAR